MGIKLVRKTRVATQESATPPAVEEASPAIVAETPPADSDELLALTGIIPDTEAPSAEATPKKGRMVIRQGDRIVITQELYPWVEVWKPGDTGIISKYYPKGPADQTDIAEIELDKPRLAGREKVYLKSEDFQVVSETRLRVAP